MGFARGAPTCDTGAAASSIRFRRRRRSCALLCALFFNRGPVLPFPEADLFLVAFPSTSGGPLRAPAETHQNFPDMPLVVQDPELLLDQVRHAWARPQRSLIAQPLRTFQQPLHQTLAFLVLQQGLAPGAAGFLQSPFPFAPALLRPTCNRLASDRG